MRPSLSIEFRRQYERVLREHPQWHDPDDRRALLHVLRDHEIWDDLDFHDKPKAAGGRLLDLYETHGPAPFRAVLSALRDGQTAPEYLREIDLLAGELRVCERRTRRDWKGDLYLGLTYFNRNDAPIFFGRDAEVERLIHTLTQTEQGRRFCVVVGASGSGKSSLVRAGLWARLTDGDVLDIPGSERWLISAMTPLRLGSPDASLRSSLTTALEEHDGFRAKVDLAAGLDHVPLGELAERLLPPGEARWLLILDQMEELFSADRKAESISFLDRLLEGTRPLPGGKPSRFQVLATLRADFLQHCLDPDHKPLQRALQHEGGQFWLSAPGRRDLEQMVRGPVTELDLPRPWTLDPDLPSEMAAEAWSPGGLALLAFALRELYDRCLAEGRRHLDLGVYRSPDFGGLGGAIARRADATLAGFGESGPGTMGRVFSRLVRVSQNDSPTRRRESRSAWEGDHESEKFIDAFVHARLLVADDLVIEVAHEALLREWPTLARWIDERREAFGIEASVRVEAHAWMEAGAHWRRAWNDELIDARRRKLAEADLLNNLLRDPAVDQFLRPELDWILAELQDDATTHQRRRDIGQRLAVIGDPRPGVGVISGVPDIVWRAVPGGEVDIEKHGRFVVKLFHMAAYPITFGQFRAFLEAEDGYDNERWWKDLESKDRDSAWQDPLTNHPVTDVSWYDAMAFCRWLSARLAIEVRLPDEREWQWAAQSAQPDDVYPWGPEWLAGRANTNESGIRRTTAVGMYPQGNSLQRVSDLAGNVWDWCLNEYAKPKRVQAGGTESRVLRGGSWNGSQDNARAGSRGSSPPDFRYYNIGFRVVCSSPIADH